MDRMREEVGRNVFQTSLAGCKQELEKIPWVESATVSRLLPNRLRVTVKERTPRAFVSLGGRVALIDAQGVVMEMPPGVPNDYTFPVILGISESEPPAARAAQMQTYVRLMRELDGEGVAGQSKPQYSRDVDEVDLSDADDVKVTAKGGMGAVLLHLGNENFLPRFMVFLTNVQKWEQERGKLESVDLRYGREVILNPDMSVPAPAPAAAKATTAAPAAVAKAPAIKAKAKIKARAKAARMKHKMSHPIGESKRK
jgi:cell division protein FtsQ